MEGEKKLGLLKTSLLFYFKSQTFIISFVANKMQNICGKKKKKMSMM